MLKPVESGQNYFTTMAAAVLHGDFECYADGVILPFRQTTAEGVRIVESREALRSGFDSFRDMLDKVDAVSMTQNVQTARLADPFRLIVAFTTRIECNEPPHLLQFNNWAELLRDHDGSAQWRAKSIKSFFSNKNSRIKMPFHLELAQ